LAGLLIAAMVLSLPLIASAQAAFEVASIRPSEPRTTVTYKYTPTGLSYTGATLGDCILAAY
jgi:Sec-independent protein secretion pathway component TatC